MSAAVEARAQEIIKARGFDGLSDLLAALVREEFERRQPPVLHETAEISSARKAELAEQLGEILSYSKKPKRKKKSQPSSDAPPK